MNILVVGDKAKILPGLEKLGYEIIELDVDGKTGGEKSFLEIQFLKRKRHSFKRVAFLFIPIIIVNLSYGKSSHHQATER